MAKSYGLSPAQIAVLRHPTTEGALEFWDYARLGEPIDPTTPLAGVHKARLRWPGASKDMVRESKRWLQENGYGTRTDGPDEGVPRAYQTRRPN